MDIRYVVTIDYYVYAQNDWEAVKKAKMDIHTLNTHSDIEMMESAIVSIVEQPFGTIGNREVYKP